jgi:murein DD-endopeptidase MepM/ murein hydrolase activator NlpD
VLRKVIALPAFFLLYFWQKETKTMSKGGKIICIVLALLLAAAGSFAFYERNQAEDLAAELADARASAEAAENAASEEAARLEEEIGALKAQVDELSAKLADAYIAPRVTFSSHEALQGDIIAVRAEMNSAEGLPEIETELGKAVFIEDPAGGSVPEIGTGTEAQSAIYTAYVPVWYAQNPGNYSIKVKIGDREYTDSVTVKARKFGEQHMTMSAATASATIGASNANEDYNQKVTPTYSTAEPVRYWEGTFIQPVSGRITTEFGLYRYTDYTDGSSRRVTRHTGVDISAVTGTPVPASNAGKVVYAGDVIMTGGTIVVDHGGGLKSYYFHLSSVDCAIGDIVEKGQIIGKVGSTGYSTGAHLHVEFKIGSYSLSPWALWDGTSDIYK